MKNVIMPMFLFFAVSINAEAVVLFTALTENPKKAETSLILRDRARQLRLNERRNELLKEYVQKTKTAAKTVSGDQSLLLQTSVASDLLTNTNQDDRASKAKETGSP